MRLTLQTFAAVVTLTLCLAANPPTRTFAQLIASCDASHSSTVLLSAQSKDGLFFEGLTAKDLNVKVNKASVPVTSVEMRTNQPMSVVFMIDNSVSQATSLSHEMLAATNFVEWALHHKDDRAAVVSFSGDAVVELDLTDDRTKILGAISKVNLERPAGYVPGPIIVGRTPPVRVERRGSTALWDAVWATTDGILKNAPNRRAMILFTNGEDTSSRSKMEETIRFAAANDIAVFAVAMYIDKRYHLIGRDDLDALTVDTGGRLFRLNKLEDMREIVQKMQIQIRSYYAVDLCLPSVSASSRPNLRIELNRSGNRDDIRLSYRRFLQNREQ